MCEQNLCEESFHMKLVMKAYKLIWDSLGLTKTMKSPVLEVEAYVFLHILANYYICEFSS